MAITAAEIETLIDAANSAADGSDYTTAVNKLRQAKALISALPDSIKDGTEIRYDRGALDALIAEYQRANATSASQDSGGVRRTKITWARVTD